MELERVICSGDIIKYVSNLKWCDLKVKRIEGIEIYKHEVRYTIVFKDNTKVDYYTQINDIL